MTDQKQKIVIVAPNFGSAIQISLVRNIRKLFAADEIALRSSTDDEDKQTDCLKKTFEQNKPTALIAMNIRPDLNIISTYTAANVPIILFDEESPGLSTISIDNYKGGYMAGEYLASKGRKKIAIVSGRTKVKGGYNAQLRLHGFQQALKSTGLSIPIGCIIEVLHYSREDGNEVMPSLLAMGVDAIFCAAGDNCAAGLMSVARERGLRIPTDVAIMGFDDLPIARLLTPTLTTISQPLEKMAQAVYDMIVTHRDTIIRNPQKATFDPELMIRKSA